MLSTDEFRTEALQFNEKGYYTKHAKGTIGSKRYWDEMAKRSIYGYKRPGGEWIPGYYYYYLNFSPIDLTTVSEEALKSDSERIQANRTTGFPEFRDAGLDYFLYLDEAEKRGEHAVLFKSRGVGYSFSSASMCNRNFFLIPGSKSFVFAESDEYLQGDGILTKTWNMMSFIDQNTAWSKRRQVKNDNYHKRASRKVNIGGIDTEKGFLSEIMGVPIGHDLDKTVRGKRGKLIVWEESGSNKHLLTGWMIALQSMAEGRFTFGLMLAGGCVCAGTKVWDNYGIQWNIEDLPRDNGILGYNGEGISKEEISYWQQPTKKPCYRITTNTKRTLECSEDHPILWSTQHYGSQPRTIVKGKRPFIKKAIFKRTDDIKIGDQIAVIEEVPLFLGVKKMWEPRLIGWLIGDGSYGKDKTPVLSNCEIEINDYIEKNFNCKIEKENLTKTGKIYKETRIKDICNKLRTLGIYGQTKLRKTLPLYIDSYTLDDVCDLLGGLYDTDGYIGKKSISIASMSYSLLNEIRMLMQKLGIHGSIHEKKFNVNNLKSKNNHFEFEIGDRKSILKFMEYIRLYPQHKKDALNLLYKSLENKNNRQSKSIKGIRFERVTKIEYIGIKNVYNLTANNTHTYIANGIVTHNTGGSSKTDMMSIETLFKKPKGYRVYAVPNKWEPGHENELAGYFWPAHYGRKGHMDVDGNSNLDSAVEEILKNRKDTAEEGDPDSLIQLTAEEPLTPSEAMLRVNYSIFNLNMIRERISVLETNTSIQDSEYIGKLVIKSDGIITWEPDDTVRPIRNYPMTTSDDFNGGIVIWEHPIKNADGEIPYGLYIASTDPYDEDKTDPNKKDSLGSTFIMNILTGRLVAEYTARPRFADDYYEQVRRLLKYYNAVCNYEQNKKGMYQYFNTMNSVHMLCDNPQILRDMDLIKVEMSGNRLKGTYVNEEINKYGRELIKKWSESPAYGEDPNTGIKNIHKIKSLPLLYEMLYWEPDRNADRISSLGLLMILKLERFKIVVDMEKKIKTLAEDPFFNKLYTGKETITGQLNSHSRTAFFDEGREVYDLDKF